jgi:hypothetical protein
VELGKDIFGDKCNPRIPANELVLWRVWPRRNQRQDGGAVGRRHGHPALTVLKPDVRYQIESNLIPVKAQAFILVANENGDRVKAQVGVPPIQQRGGAVYTIR